VAGEPGITPVILGGIEDCRRTVSALFPTGFNRGGRVT
jgi:hypothetical protein